MLGCASRRRPVVDADERGGRVSRLVDGHDRKAARECRFDTRIVARRRIDDESVHRGAAHGVGRRLAEPRVRDEQQAHGAGFHRACNAAQECRRSRVGELVAEALRDD